MIGPAQVSILRSTTWGRWFLAPDNKRYRQCLRLHSRGLLVRDPKNAWRFSASQAGQAAIIAHDDALAEKILKNTTNEGANNWLKADQGRWA